MRLIEQLSKDVPLGISAGILSAAGFGLISIVIHRAPESLSSHEIVFCRSVIGLVISLPLALRSIRALRRNEAWYLGLRAAAGAISILCFAWNLQHTSVGMANVLFNASLLLVIISGGLVGNFTTSIRAVCAVVLAFAGFVIYWQAETVTLNANVVVIGIVGASFAAIAYAALKMASISIDPWSINLAVCATSVPLSLCFGVGDWSAPTKPELFILIVVGLVSACSQYFLIVSFAKLPLALAAALVPSCIIWGVVGDVIASNHQSPIRQIVGVFLYAAGICALAADSSKRASSEKIDMESA